MKILNGKLELHVPKEGIKQQSFLSFEDWVFFMRFHKLVASTYTTNLLTWNEGYSTLPPLSPFKSCQSYMHHVLILIPQLYSADRKVENQRRDQQEVTW